jgi:hypothetical protein
MIPTWREWSHWIRVRRGIERRDVLPGAQGHMLVVVVGVRLLARDSRRRRRGRRRIIRDCFDAGIRTRFLLDRRLLVHREELALFAQTNAVFASALGVICGNKTPDLAPSTVDWSRISNGQWRGDDRGGWATDRMRQRCDGIRACCASCRRRGP